MTRYRAAASRYGTMPYRRCGSSGLKLPAVSLGLWHNFGEDRPFDAQRDILRRAFDLGITHFDLANNYGPPDGSAETHFGRHLAADFRAHRHELVIATKAGNHMWPGPYGEGGSRKHLLCSLDQSLQRMGLEFVDIFYSHRPDPDTSLEETMGALDTAVRSGKALYVGLSNYLPEQTLQAARILRELGTPLLVHQPRYSMLDRRVEDGLLDVLAAEGTGAVAFSPLAQGVLTDRYLRGVPSDSRAAKGVFLTADSLDDATMRKVRALTAVAKARGQSLAQLAVAWILRLDVLTSVLVGASSVDQLEQNLGALANLTIPPAEQDEIERILRG